MSEWDFAFGLTGQALEDALSSGATYEEWGMIERQLEREDIIGNHYHYVFAFIDAENVPSKFFEQIENGISYFVDKWNAKVYALQKDHATLNWHEIVKKNDALLEIRRAGGPAKNKVDKKIINKADVLDFVRDHSFDVLIVLGAGDLDNQVPQMTKLLNDKIAK